MLLRFCAVVLLALLGSVHAQTAETPVLAGQEMRLATRGVEATYYAVWRQDAVATVVLFSGGGGGFGKVDSKPGSWPSSQNFLVRSAPLFAGKPLNVVVYGAASDLRNMGYPERVGDAHMTDIKNLLMAIKAQSAAPVWLIGTSRGALSVAEATVRNQGALVSGLVLNSAVTSGKHATVYSSKLSSITVPTMVMFHTSDSCKVSAAGNAPALERALSAATDKKLVAISGGEGGSGDECGPLAPHGYPGREQEAVDAMAQWVTSHAAASK